MKPFILHAYLGSTVGLLAVADVGVGNAVVRVSLHTKDMAAQEHVDFTDSLSHLCSLLQCLLRQPGGHATYLVSVSKC